MSGVCLLWWLHGFSLTPPILSSFLCLEFPLCPILHCNRPKSAFFNQWYSQHTEGNLTSPLLSCLNKKEGFNINIARLYTTKQYQVRITVKIFISTLSFIISKKNYNYKYLVFNSIKDSQRIYHLSKQEAHCKQLLKL